MLSKKKHLPGDICDAHGMWLEFVAFDDGAKYGGRHYNMKVGDKFPPFSGGFPAFEHYIHMTKDHRHQGHDPKESLNG